MRTELFWNPFAQIERLAVSLQRRKRIRRLRHTPANSLSLGEIDSLELLELLKPEGITNIYDIGANVGTWTILAKSIFPDTKLEAFEPLPQHFESWKNHTSGLEGVRLHKEALGAENKNETIRVTSFSDASSVLPISKEGRARYNLEEVEQFPIKIRRLDDYLEEKKIDAPDLIKLDVQGYEIEVLKGGIKCIKKAKAIICEVSFVEIYENQCMFNDVVTWLASHDFYQRAIGMNTPLGESLEQSDILFMRQWW